MPPLRAVRPVFARKRLHVHLDRGPLGPGLRHARVLRDQALARRLRRCVARLRLDPRECLQPLEIRGRLGEPRLHVDGLRHREAFERRGLIDAILVEGRVDARAQLARLRLRGLEIVEIEETAKIKQWSIE